MARTGEPYKTARREVIKAYKAFQRADAIPGTNSFEVAITAGMGKAFDPTAMMAGMGKAFDPCPISDTFGLGADLTDGGRSVESRSED